MTSGSQSVAFSPNDSVWTVAVRSAKDRAGKPFLFFGEHSYTVDDLLASARALGGQLRDLGVNRGTKVAVMLPNRPEVLVTSLALAGLGAVEVPVNTALVGPLLRHVLVHSDSEVCLVVGDLAPTILALDLSDARLRALVVLGDDRLDDQAGGAVTLVSWGAGSGVADLGSDAGRWHDPASIMFTSGTTGPAKGAVLSHGYLLSQAQRRVQSFEVGPDDVLYTCLPLYHINAKVISFMTALLSGGQLWLAPRFSLRDFWDDIARSSATIFTFIGTMAVLLLDQRPAELETFHRARIAIGAPIPPDRFAEFERRFGVRVASGFGMTEIMGALENPAGSQRPSSCGIPAAGYDVRIINADFTECQLGEVGELVIRPPGPDGIMAGYYRQAEATVEAWQGLWFHTGDLFRREADGYYWFVDRKKDYLRRGGENISAAEVEAVINEHPEIVESAVIGVPSSQTEDELKLVAIRRTGSTLSELALANELKSMLPRFAWPRYIEFVDSLPKTATTRIEKYKLRSEWNTAGTVMVAQTDRRSR